MTKKIMVIDDEQDSLDLMRATLKSMGIDAVCFRDGRVALQEIDRHRAVLDPCERDRRPHRHPRLVAEHPAAALEAPGLRLAALWSVEGDRGRVLRVAAALRGVFVADGIRGASTVIAPPSVLASTGPAPPFTRRVPPMVCSSRTPPTSITSIFPPSVATRTEAPAATTAPSIPGPTPSPRRPA